MSDPTDSITICGERVVLGDYVEVEYATGERMKGGRIKGRVTELWDPVRDGHHQARVASGWCFHDGDIILEHTRPLLQAPETPTYLCDGPGGDYNPYEEC